jgi:hypothetical protein
MAVTMGVLMVVSLLGLAAFGAARGDITGSADSRDRKIAYAAAEAGQNYYFFQLVANPDYWTRCTTNPDPAPGVKNPVSDPWDGKTPVQDPRIWRKVSDAVGSADYTIELLPAPGKAKCDKLDPEASMINPNTGAFSIRTTGRYHGFKRSIITSFRRRSFLDFVYFTDFENFDPALAGGAACADKYRPARAGQGCTEIQFAAADDIKGPFHTNDSILTCDSPGFGRAGRNDKLEASLPAPGWTAVCTAGLSPNFRSTWLPGSQPLPVPTSNTALLTKAQAGGLVYTGTTFIRFNAAGNMTVTNQALNNNVPTNYNLPGNGVIYVQNGSGATCSQNPTTTDYAEPTGCANVYVSGQYTQSITIASARDIIVRPTQCPFGVTTTGACRQSNVTADPTLLTDGDLKKTDNGQLLGLIANNYVRVYHPCTNGTNGTPVMNTVRIDAAILSLLHSFFVDHHNCGAKLGNLTVNGAIAQKYRGAVGTTGGTGMVKDYNYDDRFKFRSPPYFLDPVAASWRILKAHEQLPAR